MASLQPPKIDSPYVGLVPYTEEDAQFFFGRERDQRVVVANLFASRLTLLYGASGVGKSSLLRAGVVKHLRHRISASRSAGERPELAVVYFNEWQGQTPLRLWNAIRAAVSDAVDPDALAGAMVRPTLSEQLAHLVGHLQADLFIIFDQFEEYFLYRGADGDPDVFETEFAKVANDVTLPISFVLSLRDDALSKLDRFKALIPNLFSNYLRVRHLTPDEAREAIVRPIEAYNALPEAQRELAGTYAIDPELVDAIVDSVRTGRVVIGDAGRGQVVTGTPLGVETPFLQLVMTALWNHETARGVHTLRRDSLAELGGAADIVRNHLRSVMEGLTAEEKNVCASLFQFLVTPSGTKIAHSANDLAGFAKRSPEEIESVLGKLSGARTRILAPVAPPNDRPGPIRYEIYHDSLAQAILEWRGRYVSEQERAQVERERAEESARQREQLAQANAVAEAQRLRAEAETLRVQEQRRSARRLKYLAAGLAILLIVAAIAAGAAILARRQTEEQRQKVIAAELEKSQVQQQASARLQEAQSQLETLAKRLQSTQQLSERDQAALKQVQSVVGQQSQSLQQSSKLSDQGASAKQQLDDAMKRIASLQGDLQKATQANASITQERDVALKTLQQVQSDLKNALAEIEQLKRQLLDRQTPTAPGGSTDSRPSTPEGEVRQALARYGAAYRNRTPKQIVAGILEVYPGFPNAGELEKRLGDYSAYDLNVSVEGVQLNADQTEAKATCSVATTFALKGGAKAAQKPARVEFTLRKAAAGWQIQSARPI